MDSESTKEVLLGPGSQALHGAKLVPAVVYATAVANNVIVATKKVKKTIAKKLVRILSHHVPPPLGGGTPRLHRLLTHARCQGKVTMSMVASDQVHRSGLSSILP